MYLQNVRLSKKANAPYENLTGPRNVAHPTERIATTWYSLPNTSISDAQSSGFVVTHACRARSIGHANVILYTFVRHER